MNVAVIGAGMTPFGKFPGLELKELGYQALSAALRDAGIKAGDIQAVYCANALAPQLLDEFTVGQGICWEAGIREIPVINVENACASGSTAFHLACIAVEAGVYDRVLVLGVEKMFVGAKKMLTAGGTDLETDLGFIVPASFALKANRYMAEFGLTREELAMVAVKNHRHGALNPKAQYGKALTPEEVLASPMIVEPLSRLDCCPQGDGAAALVLCRWETGKKSAARSVYVASSVLLSGSYRNPPDLSRWHTDFRAAEKAYRQAGLGPEDLDVVELHDAFTIAEIMHYEGLGLCPPGEGSRLIREGATELGGKIPVNPSGGLLSRGHPVGATGVAQIVEIVEQLRGEAGQRQVQGARVGLAHCMGGDQQGDTKNVTINILTNFLAT